MDEQPRLEGRYGPGPDTSFPAPGPVPPAPPVWRSSRERWGAILASWGRSVLAAALGILLIQMQQSGHLPQSPEDWQTLLYALVIGLIPMLMRTLNPSDPAFGRGAK